MSEESQYIGYTLFSTKQLVDCTRGVGCTLYSTRVERVSGLYKRSKTTRIVRQLLPLTARHTDSGTTGRIVPSQQLPGPTCT